MSPDLRVLFGKYPNTNYAVALTPNMVNMLVIKNGHLAVSKPFGPKKTGETYDEFEKDIKEKLQPLNLKLHFIDDWRHYHDLHGNVHCGTNVVRSASPQVRWWEHEPGE